MTHQRRDLTVEALARVEGEGALRISIDDGVVTGTELRIYEPPRFFEAFLRGRAHTEPPDVTARICGICPVAYQTSACNALEAACGVVVPEPLLALRRLLYLGEWMESHTLHIHLLHAPDFLGVSGAVELAVDHRHELERGLALKKVGNDLMSLVGGRAVHPVNVRLGGFHRVPRIGELTAFRPRLVEAAAAAEAVVDWVATFDVPDFEIEHPFVALSHPDRYAIDDGRLCSTAGLDIGPDEFDAHFREEQVVHSTALQGHHGDRPYLLGALARYALNHEQLSPDVRAVARRAGLDGPVRNPFRSIVVRAVEVLHAVTEAIAEIDRYRQPDQASVPVPPRTAVGCGWSEAPRGTLWHRYALDGDGTITDARIVPPTAQNQPAIEDDLRRFAQANLTLDDDTLRAGAEWVIRNHDPCISCATHFLDLTVDRR